VAAGSGLAVPVASLLAVALLPRPAAHAYGTVLLAGSAGAMVAVLVYMRLLRESMAPPSRTVLLIGGPWEGQILLTRLGPMPEEVRLFGPEMPPCSYHRHELDRNRPELRMLRYVPGDEAETAASLLQQPTAP
jgi:hypothetical protein